jgi:hypothetical protein
MGTRTGSSGTDAIATGVLDGTILRDPPDSFPGGGPDAISGRGGNGTLAAGTATTRYRAGGTRIR